MPASKKAKTTDPRPEIHVHRAGAQSISWTTTDTVRPSSDREHVTLASWQEPIGLGYSRRAVEIDIAEVPALIAYLASVLVADQAVKAKDQAA